MDKYLQRKRIDNRQSRRSATPEIIECDAAGTSHEKSNQDDSEHPWPHLIKYYGSVKTKKEYTEGNRVIYKGKIECSQCKKNFSFDTKSTHNLKLHYLTVSNLHQYFLFEFYFFLILKIYH